MLIAELLQKAWDTELLCDVSMFGSMVLVALPDKLVGRATGSLTYADAEQMQDALHHQFKIEVWQVNSVTVLFNIVRIVSSCVAILCVLCRFLSSVFRGNSIHAFQHTSTTI